MHERTDTNDEDMEEVDGPKGSMVKCSWPWGLALGAQTSSLINVQAPDDL